MKWDSYGFLSAKPDSPFLYQDGKNDILEGWLPIRGRRPNIYLLKIEGGFERKHTTNTHTHSLTTNTTQRKNKKAATIAPMCRRGERTGCDMGS